jgi:hypothetical protein
MSSFCCLHEENVAHTLCFEALAGTRSSQTLPTWCWCGWTTPLGIEIGLGGTQILDYIFQSEIQAYRANSASSIPDALTVRVLKPGNLLGLRATILDATLLRRDPIYDDSGYTYDISLMQHSPASRGVETLGRAVMAMDCDKTEGALVYCVHIGRALSQDTGSETAWLLVVNPVMEGIYRRIGTATVRQQNYACTKSSFQDILLT